MSCLFDDFCHWSFSCILCPVQLYAVTLIVVLHHGLWWACRVFVHSGAHTLSSRVSLQHPTVCWTIPHVRLCVCVTGRKGGAQAGPQEGVTGRFITRWPTSHNDAWSPAGCGAWASEANATDTHSRTHTQTWDIMGTSSSVTSRSTGGWTVALFNRRGKTKSNKVQHDHR